MKLVATCMTCFREDGHPSEELVRLAPQHEGPYEFTCSRGHEGRIILQQMLFELLFEMGIHALAEGYTREAVADFVSALERLQEFYIRLSFEDCKLDSAIIDRIWKEVASQSERQFGMFLACYVRDTGQSPPLLPKKQAEFRNQVIHRGRIPLEAEALAFGEDVLGVVRPIVSRIKIDAKDALQRLVVRHIFSQGRNEQGATTLSTPTLISLNSERREAVVDVVNQLRSRQVQ